MLEIVCGFVAGVTLHQYLMKRRKGRPRTGKNLPKDPISLEHPHAQAAIIFMSIPPESSARLFAELNPERVQELTVVITRLPLVPKDVRERVVGGFSTSLGIDPEKLGHAAAEEPALIARALVGHFHL